MHIQTRVAKLQELHLRAAAAAVPDTNRQVSATVGRCSGVDQALRDAGHEGFPGDHRDRVLRRGPAAGLAELEAVRKERDLALVQVWL
jgi:hypothetical protein